MNKTQFSPSEAGCWLDSARGQYIGQAVQEIAINHGWPLVKAILDTNNHYYCEAWSEAEEYLQDFAPEGYTIGSNECSDFGMWAVCDNCGDWTETPTDSCDLCTESIE